MSLFNIGDLLYSYDEKTIGIIYDIIQDKHSTRYKIDFLLYKGNKNEKTFNNEEWNESYIHARIISGGFSLQRKKLIN